MISQDNTQTHTSSEGGTVAGPSTGAGDRWIGKALSDYQVLNRLDAGAMGTVYRARHQHTGAMAAVKTVPTVREGLLPRIRREIHALAHVRHPGIVRILDSGTLDGVPWYAMELVEGMTLREYVPATAQTGKPEELTERLELVHQLCGALAYLHGEGLIHRDLKPSNVMVRPGHQPVLVDFGLVSEVPGAAGREALDAELGTVGTPLYMAPEQIQGELLDARTDLYALGCILYELLCGHPPFRSKKRAALLQAHLQQPPQPLLQLLPDLPPALDQLCSRLLAKDPRERLGYADDVAAILDSLGVGRLTPEAPQPRAYLYRPGFAGRADAVTTLSAGLGGVLQGAGGCVLIGAESGMGKTRLAMEAARQAQRARIRVHTGECVPERDTQGHGGGPLHPLRRTFQALADRCWEQGLAETERLLGRRGKVLALYEPALAALPGQSSHPQPAELPAEAARLRLYDDLAETFAALTHQPLSAIEEQLASMAATALPRAAGSAQSSARSGAPSSRAGTPSGLSALQLTRATPSASRSIGPSSRGAVSSPSAATARNAPVLLLLDDLQWADQLTLGFLRYLLETGALARMPLLIIGTYRLEEVGSPLQELLEAPDVQKLELGRLDASAVGSIVRDMLALGQPPHQFVGFLYDRSGGNPFFVAEYLRLAVAEGLLYRDQAGRWHVAEPDQDSGQDQYEALPLPHSVHELVGRRLDALTPSVRRVAEVAAVLGRESDETLLAATAALEGSEAFEALEELRARQVLEAIAEGHTPRLRFLHDQIWEIVYRRIAPDRRRELHRAAAETLEARLGTAKEEHLGVLGHHWEEAGEPVQARTFYRAGARRAKARYAHADAERLYRAYLQLAAADRESLEARNELALELSSQSRFQDAAEEHQKALELARTLAAPDLEVQTLQHLGEVQSSIGNLDQSRQLYQQALQLARQTENRQGIGSSLELLSHLAYVQGRFEDAREGLLQALAISQEVGDRRSEGQCLNRLSSLELQQGHTDRARTLLEQALQLHQALGDRRSAGVNLANLGVLHRHMELAEAARAYFERALAIFREIGYRRFEAHALSNLAGFHAAEGQPHHGLVLYEQALAILRDIGDRQWQGIVLANQASWLRRVGRIDEAARAIRQSEDILQGMNAQFNLVYCLSEQVRLALAQNRLPAAREVLDRVLAIASQIPTDPKGPLSVNIENLRQTFEAAEAGHPLFRGDRIEDLSPGLRRWLSDTGQLAAST